MLYNDFLINVTSFFRDQEFYKTLESTVFPSLTKERDLHDTIRIWVAGCATGEEAYSIAICLREFLENKKLTTPVQIFASDLDESAIEAARLGNYTASVLQNVPLDYLKKILYKKGWLLSDC